MASDHRLTDGQTAQPLALDCLVAEASVQHCGPDLKHTVMTLLPGMPSV